MHCAMFGGLEVCVTVPFSLQACGHNWPQVYSAYRLVEAAVQQGAAVIILNVGATRADPLAAAKLPVLAGEALMRLATHTQLLLPRV